tara:strand:+ start:222 stop:503 length:282 start_codon:yes stop_codon:yes gene_type:complete
MSVGEFQLAIKHQFPIKRNEQLYLYNKFGELLFKDEWSKLNFMDTSNIDEKDMPNVFIGYITIMQHFDFEEKSNIVNFIFQEAVKRLTGNYDY